MTTMTVTPATKLDVRMPDFVRWLANDTEPEWFREYLSPSPKARWQYLAGRFEGVLAGRDGRAFLCTEGERILGAIALERLAWDSEHFGIECGRIAVCCIAQGLSVERRGSLHAELLREALRWADENKIRLLQRRLLVRRTDEIQCLVAAGFFQADNMVTMLAPLANVTPSDGYDPRFTFRDARESDLEDLRLMTRGAFPDSRFVRDSRLKDAGGEEVYQRWIENLLRNQSSDKTPAGAKTNVMVCVVGGTVVGYAAYRTDPALDQLLGRRLGMLDLIVVGKTHRGQGMGGGLLIHTMETMRKDGIAEVEATTWIPNSGVVAFYKRAGLQEKEHLLTYHLWRN